jgi:uncharacterized repeat protein (TIGR01451 family)
VISCALLLLPQALMAAPVPAGSSGNGPLADDPATPVLRPGTTVPQLDEEQEEEFARDEAYISKRLAGDRPLTINQAAALRVAAVHAAQDLKKQGGGPTADPSTFDLQWDGIGPNPAVLVSRSGASPNLVAMSGRIGALAIRPSTGEYVLGAAQGGIWKFNATSGLWEPKADDQASLAIGALAIAPSDDSIIYAGTGEGALSGDSYFGNGVLRSNDGGEHWTHVSGDYFQAVSMSRIVVDPTDANHLYAAVLRGRGGARRVTPAVHSKYGIWESKDGAQTWTLLREVGEANGATDLEMDPQDPSILYASFWGDKVYKSTDAGQTWNPIMNGLPAGDYTVAPTRFSIGLSHPVGHDAVLYLGFEYYDGNTHEESRVWRSDDEGASWHVLPTGTGAESVLDYCDGQCFYDNVIEPDPTNPDVVFAAGVFGYDIGSGGIFRSDDGGQTWKNLGWDQHPDFHAVAFNPADTQNVLIGSDGGVWDSADQGGRHGDEPLDAVTWNDLNGRNLQITQFSSIDTVPTVPGRFWGGTQDNGTLGRLTGDVWYDTASGDGGQVLVDPTNEQFVFGTYYGISPYRFDDSGLASFFSNQSITNGINLNDRSEFYVPWVMNPANPNQLFLGTQRLYRTNNAEAPSAGDVTWTPISPDLTSGCTGTAPNGARNCSITAIGVSGGGNAVYTGSGDGLVYVSTDAVSSDSPTWTRSGKSQLPNRPVAWFAVDASNYRIAYVAYNGFNAATPSRSGHVFKTTDGGQHWTNISGNLPDSPVNSLVLDPSFANTIYAATDVGAMVTHDGGGHWSNLGSGFPTVAVNQIDLDASHRVLVAGTHGRGAFTMTDNHSVPALVVSKVDAGVPIGAGSSLTYTITLQNIGNGDATGVTLTDPIPADTSFVSASDGGTNAGGTVTWTGISVAAGDSVTREFTVSVANALKKKVKSIVNDGLRAVSAQGPSTTGSPVTTPLAPPHAVGISPATQTDGGRVGENVNYTVTVTNLGFSEDSFALTSTGGTFPVTFLDPTCTTPITATTVLASGASEAVCVSVAIPAGASDAETSTATVTATSVADATLSASATVTTIAVAVDTLLVDNDGNGPDVQAIYRQALTDAGVSFGVWDLATDTNLPQGFLDAHGTVIWFTGNSYPAPVTPYEGKLAAYLDGGGNLLMSGQDILDQAAGTTDFVHDYLHIDWDGTETQNDKATDTVTGVTGNPVTDGIGAVPLDHSVLQAAFEDQITPIDPATAAFTDDSAATNGLSVDGGAYKVVFLAFPMEAYGTAADKSDLVTRVMGYFAAP